jgi:hypothetical protein
MSSLAQRALAAVLIPAQLCLCGVDGPRGGERTNRYGFNLFSSLLLVKRSIDDWGIEETVSSYVKLNKWVLRENIKFKLFFARVEKTRNLGLDLQLFITNGDRLIDSFILHPFLLFLVLERYGSRLR